MHRNQPALFKGRHFEAEIITLCVRWYLRFARSYRNLKEMMAERSLTVDHVTIWRWVQRYAPELNRRCRPELRMANRVYHRERLEFDLRTFACEHIGLAKGYHNGELKRVLAPAIQELEEQGFLKEMSAEERFIRRSKGEWTAVFIREGKQALRTLENEPKLVKALTDRGLNRASARAIVAATPESKVQEKIAFFDWLIARKDARVQRSPSGFLYRSIAEDFALPPDYYSATATKPTKKVQKNLPLQSQTPDAKIESNFCAERNAIDEFWNSLGAEEQQRIEKDLVKTAAPFLREQYVDGRQERGILFQTVRQAMIDEYARKTLSARRKAA